MSNTILTFVVVFFGTIVVGFIFGMLAILLGWQGALLLIGAALLFATIAAIIDHITERGPA